MIVERCRREGRGVVFISRWDRYEVIVWIGIRSWEMGEGLLLIEGGEIRDIVVVVEVEEWERGRWVLKDEVCGVWLLSGSVGVGRGGVEVGVVWKVMVWVEVMILKCINVG